MNQNENKKPFQSIEPIINNLESIPLNKNQENEDSIVDYINEIEPYRAIEPKLSRRSRITKKTNQNN